MWKAERQGVDIIGGQQNWAAALKSYVAEQKCDLVIAAWGNHGKKRGVFVAKEWPEIMCLARNSDGSPKHPLYLKADLMPAPFS
jgi:hypothetical protein